MPSINLLYKKEYAINDRIKVMIPTVEKVLDNEDTYYPMVSMITATPYDMMVQLDDIGIDFMTLNDYQLFLLVFNSLKGQDTSLLFGDLDLTAFSMVVNPQNNAFVLRDPTTGTVIDRAIYAKICATLRTIHNLKRNHRKPANDEAKKFLLQRARAKMKRHRNTSESSQLEGLITAMVNTEQFPYNYEDVGQLSIYQFNESLQQVIKKIDFDNKMHGIYAGTLSAKDLGQDELNWLTHK